MPYAKSSDGGQKGFFEAAAAVEVSCCSTLSRSEHRDFSSVGPVC